MIPVDQMRWLAQFGYGGYGTPEGPVDRIEEGTHRDPTCLRNPADKGNLIDLKNRFRWTLEIPGSILLVPNEVLGLCTPPFFP